MTERGTQVVANSKFVAARFGYYVTTVQSGLIMSGPEWERGTRTVFPVDNSSVTHAAVSARALGVKEELGVRRAWGGVSEQSAGIPKRAHSYKAPPCG